MATLGPLGASWGLSGALWAPWRPRRLWRLPPRASEALEGSPEASGPRSHQAGSAAQKGAEPGEGEGANGGRVCADPRVYIRALTQELSSATLPYFRVTAPTARMPQPADHTSLPPCIRASAEKYVPLGVRDWLSCSGFPKDTLEVELARVPQPSRSLPKQA